MTHHPDHDQLMGLARGSLPTKDVLRVGEHLCVCAECRDALQALLPPRADAALLFEPIEHLDEEEIAEAAAAADSLSAEQRRHLAECSLCAAEVALCRASAKKPASTIVVFPARRWMYAAAAMLAGTIALSLTLLHLRKSEPAFALQDNGTAIALGRNGVLQAQADMPDREKQMLAQVLRDLRLPVNANLFSGAMQDRKLRGPEKPVRPLEALSPIQEPVLSRPTFQWRSSVDASSFSVEVYDASFNLVESSGPIHEQSWISSGTLQAGQIYTWIVRANTAHGVVQAPEPPEPVARFRVVDADMLSAIESAQHKARQSHLLLASLYAKAGMCAQASVEMQALLQENSSSAEASELLRSLAQSCPTRTNPAQ